MIAWDPIEEMWDGIEHRIPLRGFLAASIAADILGFLPRRLKAAGIETVYRCGLFRRSAAMDYRVPDSCSTRPTRAS